MRKPEVFKGDLCEDGSRFEYLCTAENTVDDIRCIYKHTLPNGQVNYYMDTYAPEGYVVLGIGVAVSDGKKISDKKRKNDITLICEVSPDGKEVCHNIYGLTSEYLNSLSSAHEVYFHPEDQEFRIDGTLIKKGKIVEYVDPCTNKRIINKYYKNGNLAEKGYFVAHGCLPDIFEAHFPDGKIKYA